MTLIHIWLIATVAATHPDFIDREANERVLKEAQEKLEKEIEREVSDDYLMLEDMKKGIIL